MWIEDYELFISILWSPVLYILRRPGLRTSGGPSSLEAGERGPVPSSWFHPSPGVKPARLLELFFPLGGCSGFPVCCLRMFKAKEQLSSCSASELAFQRPMLRGHCPSEQLVGGWWVYPHSPVWVIRYFCENDFLFVGRLGLWCWKFLLY